MTPSGAAKTQSRRGTIQGISVQTPLGDKAFVVRRFEYTEELGEPFQLVLELESENTSIAGSQLVGQGFSVTLALPGGGERHFHAIMGEFGRIGQEGQLARYRAVGIPWFSLLKLAENSQILQNMNVRDVMQNVFGAFDFAKYEMKGFYPKTEWEARTQYRESYFNFIQRSTQQEGIYYFWAHEQSQHTLTFCDTIANHAPFPGYANISYSSSERGQESQEHIYEWNFNTVVQPSAVVLKDYNYSDPGTSLLETTSAQQPLGPSSLEVFDYPGLFQKTSDGERYAQVRMEERECRQQVFRGRAQCLGLAAGSTFSLKDFPVESENGPYLTTAMRLTVGTAGDADDGAQTGRGPAGESGYWYDCEFSAIPSSVQFRARFSARVPQVLGLQTAFVYAPDGQSPQTPYTDSLGRIQLLFPWSRNGKQTAWVRKAQVMAGDGWGHMHCPRQGDEVLVAFEHGNVDRPVIVGCLFNGNTKPPLPLPDAAHIHVFKDQGGNLFTLNPQEDGQTVTLSSPVAKSALTLGASTKNPS
jgi:type VI secretion system secreted protein VgrG